MAEYTQRERPFRLDTVLGEDVLLLNGFNGMEALSHAYSFQLDLLSTNPEIDPDSILRSPAVVTINLEQTDEHRFIHGHISRLTQLGMQDDLAVYRAELVPWLWFLRLSRESRIYQEKTVPEIIEDTFTRLGWNDFELRLSRTYEPRLYCVQYRESHFDFVSRLMEEEGIWYFFEHTEDKHMLVLCDDNASTSEKPGSAAARFSEESSQLEEVVSDLEREYSVHPSKVTLWDYDYLQPKLKLHASLGDGSAEEVYDYPGEYKGAIAAGEKIARLLLEIEEAERQLLKGVSSVRSLVPGHHFKLEEHFRRDMNAQYLITEVHHVATAGQYRAWDRSAGLNYENEFAAIPFDTVYRPPRRTAQPLVHGSQTAMVVGPSGEEVYTDKHGRVKVQFYWDRVGQFDEKSSCWIRVSTPWGGKGYGSVSIPRIGNEVVIAFEEGNPDRPLIIGSVYNADQTPPYELPGAGIQMGMKSRSSKGGGGRNEITMTDTKGTELINIHAQYDMTTTVLHDDTQSVKNDRTISVDGTHTETIKKDTSITVSEGNLNHDVTAGTATYHVKGAVKEDYDATQATTVKSDITIISKDGGIAIAADSKHVYIKGATSIQLTVGESMIWMDSGGQINIKGVNVAINGSGSVTIKGGTVHSEAQSQHQTKGAIVMSEGSATNTIKGGMVMLNP